MPTWRIGAPARAVAKCFAKVRAEKSILLQSVSHIIFDDDDMLIAMFISLSNSGLFPQLHSMPVHSSIS